MQERVRSASGPVHEQAVATLVGQVRRCRRRLVWIMFVRHACATCGTAALAAVMAVRTITSASGQEWLWLGVAAAGGVLVAAIAALLRAPSLRATGAALDRRFALADAVAAGLELQDNPDPMARLVVQSAAGHVSAMSVPRVFPVTIGRPALTAAAAGVLAVVLMSASGPRTVRPRDTGSPDGSGTAIATSEPRGREGAAPARDLGRAAAQPDAVPRPGERPDRDDGSVAQRSNVSAASPAAAQRPTDEETRAPGDVDDRASNAPAAAAAPPDAGRPSPGRLASGAGAGQPGPEASTAASASGPSRGRGAGGDGAASTTASAGGVRGGTSRGASGGPLAAGSTMPPGSAARIREARAQAEAALSHDEVPPRLRGYVRDYFAALQPTER